MSNEEKMNELRAVALEKELRKKKKIDLEGEAMEAEIEYQADALAHSDAPSSSLRRGGGKKIAILALIVTLIIGIGYFVFSGSHPKSDNEDGEICRTPCNDGTCSPSVGPGTCSYHGGIKRDDSDDDKKSLRSAKKK